MCVHNILIKCSSFCNRLPRQNFLAKLYIMLMNYDLLSERNKYVRLEYKNLLLCLIHGYIKKLPTSYIERREWSPKITAKDFVIKCPLRPKFDQGIDIKIALPKLSVYVHIKNVYEAKYWLFIQLISFLTLVLIEFILHLLRCQSHHIYLC